MSRYFSGLTRFLLCLWALVFSLTPLSVFSESINFKSHDPEIKAEGNVHLWYRNHSHFGVTPMTIHLKNDSQKTLTWKLTANLSENYYEYPLVVEAGKSLTRYLEIPSYTHSHYTSYQQIQIEGPGIYESFNFEADRVPFVIGSKLIAKAPKELYDFVLQDQHTVTQIGKLKTKFSILDMKESPSSWRAFSSFAALFLHEDDWNDMSADARIALLDWLNMGGKLHFYTTDLSESTLQKFPFFRLSSHDQPGYARVNFLETSSEPAKIIESLNTLSAETPSVLLLSDQLNSSLNSGIDSRLGLFDTHYKENSIPSILILLMLFFVILIGPVNYFFIAGPKRRHRLFLTIPLISLGASLVLILILILHDGFGGSGARVVLVKLFDDQAKTGIIQDQKSQTGILMNNAFPVVESVFYEQKSSSPNARIPANAIRYFETPSMLSGSWFLNRSRQTQTLLQVKPGRESFEWVSHPSEANHGGSILSSFEIPITRLYLFGENGDLWKAENLRPGETSPLERTDLADFLSWRDHLTSEVLGEDTSNQLISAPLVPGSVFAESSRTGKLAIPTLKSIQWDHELTLITGRIQKSSFQASHAQP